MPLWDSVQRSLEKASQEAARIARTQRLRSITDGLTRQISTHNSSIVNKTMDLYLAGQLTQSELLPLCQEMINLHQQLNQAQNELKQLQMQAPPSAPGAPGMQAPMPPQGVANPGQQPSSPVTGEVEQASYPTTEGGQNTLYAPPPPGYQPYLDNTNAYTMPPPPPSMEPKTISSQETVIVGMATPQTNNILCAVCRYEVQPTTTFCPNCGSPVQEGASQHLPTMRGGTIEQLYSDEQLTRAASPGSPSSAYDNQSSDQETIRANAPIQKLPPNNAAPAPE